MNLSSSNNLIMNGQHLKQISEEVFYTESPLVMVYPQDITFLKEQALRNKRKRCRLCVHRDTKDRIHEMLIVHAKDNYVRPHKHIDKSESFHVIEGEATVIFFGEDGQITNTIQLGDRTSGKPFYYRISDDWYHTLVVKSDFIVYHETTNGPFNRADTINAPWAADECDEESVRAYMQTLWEHCRC